MGTPKSICDPKISLGHPRIPNHRPFFRKPHTTNPGLALKPCFQLFLYPQDISPIPEPGARPARFQQKTETRRITSTASAAQPAVRMGEVTRPLSIQSTTPNSRTGCMVLGLKGYSVVGMSPGRRVCILQDFPLNWLGEFLGILHQSSLTTHPRY